MKTKTNLQFSLAELMTFMTAVCVLSSLAVPAYTAGVQIDWSEPWIGCSVGVLGTVLAVGTGVVLLFRD